MQDTAGEAGTSSLVMYSYGPPHMAGQKQDDQLEHTYGSSVPIRDVALKTCQRLWTIGKSGERRSGISLLVAQHDDDDDIYLSIYLIDSLVNLEEWGPNSLVKDVNCIIIYTGDFFYIGEGLCRTSHSSWISWQQKNSAPMCLRFSWTTLSGFEFWVFLSSRLVVLTKLVSNIYPTILPIYIYMIEEM